MFFYQGKHKIQLDMAEYEMQESNLPNKEGKRILYPRLVLYGQRDTGYIARKLASATTFTPGEVTGLLQVLADEIASQLAQGYSIKLDGIGNFTASLALSHGKERETGEAESPKRNAQSIEIGYINFRPDKKWIKQTNLQCVLSRSQKKFRRSLQKYSPQQRKDQALTHLNTHPVLTVSDYMQLTGLRRTTAAIELKTWAAQPDSPIDISGEGKHRIYIRRTETGADTGKPEAPVRKPAPTGRQTAGSES